MKNTKKIGFFLCVFCFSAVVSVAQQQQQQQQRTTTTAAQPARPAGTQQQQQPARPAATPQQQQSRPAPTGSAPRQDALGRQLEQTRNSIDKLFNAPSSSDVSRKQVLLQLLDTVAKVGPYIDQDTLAAQIYYTKYVEIYSDLAMLGDGDTAYANTALAYLDTCITGGYNSNTPGVDYQRMAMLYFHVLKDTKNSLTYLDKSIEAGFNVGLSYLTKAQIFQELKRTADACYALKQAQDAGMTDLDALLKYYGCD